MAVDDRSLDRTLPFAKLLIDNGNPIVFRDLSLTQKEKVKGFFSSQGYDVSHKAQNFYIKNNQIVWDYNLKVWRSLK